MSARDAARLTSYAQQSNPNILHQIMGPGGLLASPEATMAAALGTVRSWECALYKMMVRKYSTARKAESALFRGFIERLR
jgi:hypothetical protein